MSNNNHRDVTKLDIDYVIIQICETYLDLTELLQQYEEVLVERVQLQQWCAAAELKQLVGAPQHKEANISFDFDN